MAYSAIQHRFWLSLALVSLIFTTACTKGTDFTSDEEVIEPAFLPPASETPEEEEGEDPEGGIEIPEDQDPTCEDYAPNLEISGIPTNTDYLIDLRDNDTSNDSHELSWSYSISNAENIQIKGMTMALVKRDNVGVGPWGIHTNFTIGETFPTSGSHDSNLTLNEGSGQMPQARIQIALKYTVETDNETELSCAKSTYSPSFSVLIQKNCGGSSKRCVLFGKDKSFAQIADNYNEGQYKPYQDGTQQFSNKPHANMHVPFFFELSNDVVDWLGDPADLKERVEKVTLLIRTGAGDWTGTEGGMFSGVSWGNIPPGRQVNQNEGWIYKDLVAWDDSLQVRIDYITLSKINPKVCPSKSNHPINPFLALVTNYEGCVTHVKNFQLFEKYAVSGTDCKSVSGRQRICTYSFDLDKDLLWPDKTANGKSAAELIANHLEKLKDGNSLMRYIPGAVSDDTSVEKTELIIDLK